MTFTRVVRDCHHHPFSTFGSELVALLVNALITLIPAAALTASVPPRKRPRRARAPANAVWAANTCRHHNTKLRALALPYTHIPFISPPSPPSPRSVERFATSAHCQGVAFVTPSIFLKLCVGRSGDHRETMSPDPLHFARHTILKFFRETWQRHARSLPERFPCSSLPIHPSFTHFARRSFRATRKCNFPVYLRCASNRSACSPDHQTHTRKGNRNQTPFINSLYLPHLSHASTLLRRGG
jgi:hypothetical protein